MALVRSEPDWLEVQLLLTIHDRQLAEHGGLSGVRDEGALESAAMRPVNQWAYGEDDCCQLAASLAFGIARNHPFSDGNKRTAWVAGRLFLAMNGCELTFAQEDAIAAVLALAAGELGEDEFADWFRERLVTG